MQGEVASSAVVREVWEEMGLRVEVGDVLFCWEGVRAVDEPRTLELVFRAELAGKERTPRSDDPAEEAAFVPVDELTALNLYPPIAGYLRGASREDFPPGARYLGNMRRSRTQLGDGSAGAISS